jgi:nicotinamidase-related amidase
VIRAFGLEIPQSLEEACDPARTALIVYDMQIGIVRQLRDGQAVVERVSQVLRAARAAGLRVVFLRHMSPPKELMGMFQLRQAMAWQRVNTVEQVQPWFLRDSTAFQLVPELMPLSSEAVFDKITMSAFEGTPLDIVFRDCGIQAFVIAGIALEIGIEPTMRHGADLGYIPILVADACGAGHEDARERSLETLRYLGDAFFTTVDELQAVLASKTAPQVAPRSEARE